MKDVTNSILNHSSTVIFSVSYLAQSFSFSEKSICVLWLVIGALYTTEMPENPTYNISTIFQSEICKMYNPCSLKTRTK